MVEWRQERGVPALDDVLRQRDLVEPQGGATCDLPNAERDADRNDQPDDLIVLRASLRAGRC